MLLDIPYSKRDKVGLLIDYTRKEKMKIQKEYKIDTFIQGICSKQTYNKIVKGQIVNESEIYDSLIYRLGYCYLYDENIIHEIDLKIQSLMTLLDTGQKQKFYKCVSQLCDMLKEYEDYFLESILYDIFVTIKNNQCHKNIKKMIDLYPMFNSHTKEVCGYFILKAIYEMYSDEYCYEDIEKIGLVDVHLNVNRLLIVNLLSRWQYYFDASCLCQQLINIYKQKNDDWGLYQAYIRKLYIMMNIQPQTFESYAKKVENFYYQHQFDSYEIYHILGCFFYQKENYLKARKYLEIAMKDDHYTFPEYIMLNHIATITNTKISFEKKDIEKQHSYYPFYHYYEMKNQKVDYEVLENYLWQECRTKMKLFYPFSLVKKMICDEMEWLVGQTGHRSLLYYIHKMK